MVDASMFNNHWDNPASILVLQKWECRRKTFWNQSPNVSIKLYRQKLARECVRKKYKEGTI
jgi:hypothetical protein